MTDTSEQRKVLWPLGGYAPGHYMGKCFLCEQQMIDVDKRAMSCLPCAVELANNALAALRTHRKLDDEEAVSAMRLQGQSEGFAAAVHWLRDRNASVGSVDAPLKASEWADMLEDSRIAKSHREPKP